MENLEKSLSEAFVTDAKRKAEDEMKKRAIVTAKSYDEFRHLVAAAQQKPLDPRDIARKAEVSANRALGGSNTRREAALGFDLGLSVASISSSTASTAAGTAAATAAGNGQGTGSAFGHTLGAGSLPSTAAEFDRAWRRLPKDESARAACLCRVGPQRLTAIFAGDVDGELLAALLKTLAAACSALPSAAAGEASADSPASPSLYASLALSLTTSQGFSLAVDLLSKAELGNAKAIAEAASAAGAQEIADKLRSAYHV